MTSVTLQPELETQLNGLGERVELHNPEGKLIGYFVSPEAYTKLLYAYAKTLINEEELEKARKQPGVRTTAQVIERLRALESQYPPIDLTQAN
jgi:hypothetical protein